MHSHQGLQEQLLMAAPLIIRDQRDRPDQQEVVVMLADFSFTPPDQIFAELKKGVGMAMPAGAGRSSADRSEGLDGEHAEDGSGYQTRSERRQVRCFSRQ
jgi:FtsP/CotA-like multicopper oxidase with cupredoxin domain